ncbi:MAG: FAD-dependent oxidoreductase [Phycisphaerae bacterium]
MQKYTEPARDLPVREYDVVVAGGGTAGVIAALAAARRGARTALVESKGYLGGVAVEGGTALHSFYNLWKAFPEVEKKQVVRGLPQELIDRLAEVGGTSGHAEMTRGFDYDSVCTAIDVELYKLIAAEMLNEAGADMLLNTMVVDAHTDDGGVTAAIVQSRSGREALIARCFIDSTGYGDLAAAAGADYDEPNDHPVANSIGVGGVDIEKYAEWLDSHDALTQHSQGLRDGVDGKIVRLDGRKDRLPQEFAEQAKQIGMALVITSVRDDYFMFLKLNLKLPVSPTDRDAVSRGELELRRRQHQAVRLLREYVPGCEKAFIARSSPSLCIRRGRRIVCDYDISLEDILSGRHFDDDVMHYGFHDSAPRLQIRDGGTYGLPYRALRPAGIDNLLVAGMLITSDWEAHMSTRNTVCCMGQGQAVGTAAALCAAENLTIRQLPVDRLQATLRADGVYLGD